MSEELPGLDPQALAAFFVSSTPFRDAPRRFELMTTGLACLTYRVVGDGWTCMLRRSPLVATGERRGRVLREHRVLSAISQTEIPAPRPLALCEDAAVIGAPFYLMEDRPGIVLHAGIPEGFATSEAERGAIGAVLIETLARLHALDHEALGLADFGPPGAFLEREVARWLDYWQEIRTRERGDLDELARRLGRAMPADSGRTLVHGDYRLGNIALDPEDPGRIAAIYDWELSTVGDPLSDVAYLLAFWLQADDPPDLVAEDHVSAVPARPGFATRAELVEAYARASGRDVPTLEFHQVLALYKLAVVSEAAVLQSQAGAIASAEAGHAAVTAISMARRALAIADRAEDRRLRGS
jgi:aminoglycoside phosphotransferase (APT) family kinase protein